MVPCVEVIGFFGVFQVVRWLLGTGHLGYYLLILASFLGGLGGCAAIVGDRVMSCAWEQLLVWSGLGVLSRCCIELVSVP